VSSDLARFRARIYATYVATTAANPFAGPALPLAEALAQYRRRWAGYLPASRDARILDLGCGGGEFLLFLEGQGYSRLEGVDVSPEQVELARRRGLKSVQVADALDYLETNRGPYDLVNAQHVLEHLTRPELLRLLDAVVAALQPGGRLFAVVPNAKGLFSARIRYADLTHELSFTPESLRQVCATVGLRPVAMREHGPLAHGPASGLRWGAWQLVRLATWIALTAESADYGERIYTNNVMLVAEKP
jgi:2-polyprenyl-3-methyl-5-hydroxy-6-metoxy-1,4-benzoquinol methylase